MQALKRIWSEELDHQLQTLSVRIQPALLESAAGLARRADPEPDDAEPASTENVLRPLVFQRDPAEGSPCPEAPPAVDAAPARPRPELSALLELVTKAAEHVRNADARAERTERQAADLADRTRAQLERAEVLLESAQNAIGSLEGEIDALTARLIESEAAIADAQARVFAAETRALEARDDMIDLESCLREQFGMVAS